MRLEMTNFVQNVILTIVGAVTFLFVLDYGCASFDKSQTIEHKEKLIQMEINRTCPKVTCPNVEPCPVVKKVKTQGE